MKIIYDREVNALSIIFQETTVTTQHLSVGIAVDYDAKGKLASIEILDATKLPMLCINKLKHWQLRSMLGKAPAKRFGFSIGGLPQTRFAFTTNLEKRALRLLRISANALCVYYE